MTTSAPRRLVPIQPRPLVGSEEDKRSALEAVASAAKDAQRRRHRLAVKRAYHAKLNGLSALRDEEHALAIQYEQIVQQQQRETDASQPDDAKVLYLKLMEVRRALERENAALRKVAAEHTQFQMRIQQAALFEGVLTVKTSDDEGDSSSSDGTSPTVVKPVVKIKPLTAADCFDVIRDTWPQVLAFRRNCKSLALGSEVFGWSHKYRFPPAVDPLPDSTSTASTVTLSHRLQYSISKIFPSMSAYELSQRGWEIMTTQRHYQALHSATMTSQLHLVQRVDNDNMVFLRVLKRGGQSTMFKTLLLMSQFQVDNGVLTIFRGLDPGRVINESVEDKGPSVVWLEMFSWTYFEDHDDGTSVKFEFGGEMRHSSNDNARFWMMEVLLMALRWENMAVGPLFKLSNA